MGKKRPDESAEQVGEILLDPEPGMEPSPDVLADSRPDPSRPDGGEPPPYRTGLTRRQIFAGVGALALAGGAWWLNEGSPGVPGLTANPAVPTAPAVRPGPRPLWVHRGVVAQSPESLVGYTSLPVFADGDTLLVLDPATGAERRRIDLSDGKDREGAPSRPSLSPPALAGADRVFDSWIGRIRSVHLTDPSADWQLPCPPELGGSDEQVQLQTCVDGVLYGTTGPTGQGEPTTVFALSAEAGRLLWIHRLAREDWLSGVLPAPGGRLLGLEGAGQLVMLKAADGSREWSVPVGEQFSVRGLGPEHVYTSDRVGGMQAIRLGDGGTAWTITPEQGDTWRYLWARAVDGDVLLLRDDSRLARHAAADGARKWSVKVPFRLDYRSIPVLVRDTLYVPGPADAGVCAVDVHTGELRWQFRDSGPGVQVWNLRTDGERLFAGRDLQLYALPL
ncbi:PQQ-binding-like beta-propeller repeat protein [Kitasatospora sp. NPDC056138]|uniref:outer membrane protein assembly factor BamB family protein n=1 Tax=Kitasatospora sp. NPDC056138 TaxID=3345724 RepID=UPI0035E1A550